MPEMITQELCLLAAGAWLIGVTISKNFVSLKVSIVIATLKTGVVFIYFGMFYDGTWTILDDMVYYSVSQVLLDSEFNPISLLGTTGGLEALEKASDESRHILYIWWVYTAQYLTVQTYFASVFFNVVLTYIVGAILYSLCRSEMFDTRYAKGLFVMFLLHWDVLVWSSFISIKDTLVMTLTIICFALIWFLLKRARWNVSTLLAVLALSALIYSLTFIRFYIPVLLLAAVFLYLIVISSGKSRNYLAIGAAVVLGGVIILTPLVQFHIAKDITFDGFSFVFGLLRFPLTPRPWSLEPAYTFLLVPSILHWLLLIPLVYGAVNLWKVSGLARLFLLFLILAIAFYALVEVLQNTRQRYQLSYIIVWLQYHGVVMLLNRFWRRGLIPVAA